MLKLLGAAAAMAPLAATLELSTPNWVFHVKGNFNVTYSILFKMSFAQMYF